MQNARVQGAASFEIAEVLTNRLAHDVAGALGTIAASLALADEDLEGAEEARAIAGDAAETAVRRLKLLRAAWGSPAPLSGQEMQRLGAALPRTTLHALPAVAADEILDAPLARVLLNILLLAADSLPRGGEISLGREGDGAFLVTLEGPQAAWPAQLGRYLADPEYALAAFHAPESDHARGTQGPLTALLAHWAGLEITLLANRGERQASTLRLASHPSV